MTQPLFDIRETDIPNSDGIRITIRRVPKPDAAMFWLRPDQWIAWHLRRLAERIDGDMSYSIHVSVAPSSGINYEDWKDALTFGHTAMTRYLADLKNERSL